MDLLSPEAVGTRIRDARMGLCMTQSDLAKRLGVSTSYVSFLESGKRPLTHQITMALLRCLNISYSYLVMGKLSTENDFISSVCEASSYNERLQLEHLLEQCTKAEYEMCYQLCSAYLKTSRSLHPSKDSAPKHYNKL